ncbi:MAG: hypothetical protein ACYCZX_10565, partial [Rhodospirillaceae bacterium]
GEAAHLLLVIKTDLFGADLFAECVDHDGRDIGLGLRQRFRGTEDAKGRPKGRAKARERRAGADGHERPLNRARTPVSPGASVRQ